MTKRPKSRPPAGGRSTKVSADQLHDQLAEGSRRLVELYDQVGAFQDRRSRIIADADLSLGPVEYERLRKRLEALEPEINQLAGQIRIELAKLRKIQSESRQSSQYENRPAEAIEDPSKRLDAEILALDKRLLEIADGQQAAVKAWNADPTSLARPEFEAKMARLHAEFAAILAQKKALLEAKKALLA